MVDSFWVYTLNAIVYGLVGFTFGWIASWYARDRYDKV